MLLLLGGIVLAGNLAGQHGVYGPWRNLPYRPFGSASGFGKHSVSGRGHAPPVGSITDPRASPADWAQTVRGNPSTGAAQAWERGGTGRLVVPYPVYVGGYGYSYAPEPAAPNITIVNQGPQRRAR